MTKHRTRDSYLRNGPATTALAFALTMFVGQAAAWADVNTFTLRQPLNNATVRETVPIRVPRNLLNQAGYATVTIDGQFRGAQAVPDKGDIVYRWDTKNPFTTSDNPDTQQLTPDGKHTITVALFDKDSSEMAEANSTVRVANKITTLPDGVRLEYKWRPNMTVTYTIHDETKPAGGDDTSTQVVDARVNRSVEDINGNEILLRDRVVPSGTVGGTPISQLYTVAAKFWTVNRSGDLLADNKPIAAGNHLGFPITELPDRRVNVGDSWQTHIMASLPWSSEHLTSLHGTARLDSFEWQNGYPTAKIVETYSGPAQFVVTTQQGNSPPAKATVNLTRTVWFAYEAGMVVRSETKMHTDGQLPPEAVAALSVQGGGASASPFGGAGGPYGGGPYGGGPSGGQGGGPYGGAPYGGPAAGGMNGSESAMMRAMGRGGFKSGPGGGGPGMAPYGGAPGAAPYGGMPGNPNIAQQTNVQPGKYDSTVTMVLAGVARS